MLKLDWNLVFTIINLIVLYFLLKKFLIGPIMKIMEERKNQIEGDLNSAKKANEDAEALKAQYHDALANARTDADHIIEKARKDASLEYDRIVNHAETEAKGRIDAADQTIETDKNQAISQLKQEIAGLTMDATDKILGRVSDAENDKALYERFLEEAGEGND